MNIPIFSQLRPSISSITSKFIDELQKSLSIRQSVYSLDRFEGNFAVLESPNGKMDLVSKDKLPQNATEGDLFSFIDGKYIYEKEKTIKRRNYLEEKRKKLYN